MSVGLPVAQRLARNSRKKRQERLVDMSSDLDADADSAHAIYQSWDRMKGLAPDKADVATQSRRRNWREIFHRIYPGLLVAATITLAATWLAQQHRSPVMLFALPFGMTFPLPL